MYCIVCVWQAYNDGEKTIFESALTLVLEGVQLKVECLKGYGTIKSLGTTAVVSPSLCIFLPLSVSVCISLSL